MSRLAEYTVVSGSLARRALASVPTSTPPPVGNATTDGWIRSPWGPSANSTPVGVATATTELVVPRSMPTAKDIGNILRFGPRRARGGEVLPAISWTSGALHPTGVRYSSILSTGNV